MSTSTYLTDAEVQRAKSLRRQGLSLATIAERMKRQRNEIARVTRDIDMGRAKKTRPHCLAYRLNRLQRLHLLLQKDRETRVPPPVTLPRISFLVEEVA